MAPGRRARRGDGLRVAGRRRVHAGLDVLADRGHHPRPGARHPRPGAARAAAVLEGRHHRPTGRARPARSAPSPASSAACRPARPANGCWPPGSTAGRPTTCWPTSTSSARRPATCPTTAPSWSSGSATSWATGGWRCTRRSGRRCTRRGRWRSRPGCASGYGVDVQAMHADDGIVLRLPDIELDSARLGRPGPAPRWPSSSRTTSSRWSPTRSAARRCSRPGSASAPRGPCCCRDATPAGGQPVVAAAAALGAAAVGGQRVRLVPDRARDDARVPAGRVRRARAGRPDARGRRSAGALRRGRDPAAVAVRPVAAVRLRRAVPLRGRLTAGRAPGAGTVPRRDAAGRAARPAGRRGAARAARPRRDRLPRAATCSGSPTTAGPATSKASPTCCGCSAR